MRCTTVLPAWLLATTQTLPWEADDYWDSRKKNVNKFIYPTLKITSFWYRQQENQIWLLRVQINGPKHRILFQLFIKKIRYCDGELPIHEKAGSTNMIILHVPHTLGYNDLDFFWQYGASQTEKNGILRHIYKIRFFVSAVSSAFGFKVSKKC